MGIRQDLLAKLAQFKAQWEARQAALSNGRAPKILTAEELAKGHPKVSVRRDFQGVIYGVRRGSYFGWVWLIFTCVHCVALFSGLAGGTAKINGVAVASASWWHFALLAVFYVPFFLIGFALTLARYQVTLADDLVQVRWCVLPYVGWTWSLATGDEVKVLLAYRGARVNKEPVESVVVASQGKEIDFGAFLPLDVKEHLAAVIRDYYQGGDPVGAPSEPAPFISAS